MAKQRKLGKISENKTSTLTSQNIFTSDDRDSVSNSNRHTGTTTGQFIFICIVHPLFL